MQCWSWSNINHDVPGTKWNTKMGGNILTGGMVGIGMGSFQFSQIFVASQSALMHNTKDP